MKTYRMSTAVEAFESIEAAFNTQPGENDNPALEKHLNLAHDEVAKASIEDGADLDAALRFAREHEGDITVAKVLRTADRYCNP
ncbi:MAG TPA: hypothetical protein VHE09_14590 [Rhizomicrobium sp.]|nr:hypothetical protein [Rhizomicrobium sp.]